MKLTGRTRYRTNWRGKLILQVEEAGIEVDYDLYHVESHNVTSWRDAKVVDLHHFSIEAT
ncbi:hypothetical protein [Brucella pituitosa]|uniref:hypothetical protein n=1 Tax=Brucella pituitosa TaxID=571256 RepID=UPI000CFE613F|nr:hypothetical protein CQ062_23345 [Ochrobactrum sp. MYb68]